MDDSTSSQVYNNQEWSETAAEAVRATEGQILVNEGKVAAAYYYSTSCGYGADASVWNDSVECGFVAASSLTAARETLDLSEELSFRQFLESSQDSWDSGYPWYRWTTERSANMLTELTNTWLSSRRQDTVGTVTDISVEKRLENGAAVLLNITGEDGTARVEGTSDIRSLLGSASLPITLQNGKEQTGISLLPSAFFYVEAVSDSVWRICGGGFGHGVGMSQDGADGMAAEGYSYLSILSFFYRNVSICEIY